MNKQTFLLQNQDKYLLSKNNEWVDGRDLRDLFKTPHRDVAMNQLFEVNSHDYQQRIHILECETKGHNLPLIEEADLPPPLPKQGKEEKGEVADDNAPEVTLAGGETAKVSDQITDTGAEASSNAEPSQALNPQESEIVRNPEGELLVHEV